MMIQLAERLAPAHLVRAVGWIVIGLWLLPVGERELAGGAPALLGPAPATNHSPVSVWDVSARGEVGGGYRDNVLLASVAPESSAFVSVAADASLIRLSESGSELTMFFMGEYRHYSDIPSIGEEAFASGTVQFARPVSRLDKLGVEIRSLYQNQVMDVSETETNLMRTLVEGVGISLAPNWTRNFGKGWRVRLEGIGGWQYYLSDLSNYWEAGGKLSLTRSYGHRSELSVNLQSLHWLYDDRAQTDRDGMPLAGTSLTFWRPEVFGQWRHSWDQQRHWTTTSKVGWLWNRDNGPGYWDYHRLQVSQKVRWKEGGWEVAGGARLGWYWYSAQSAGTEQRERSYAIVDLRVERRVGKHWFVFAAAEREWNWSNEPLDEYDDWTAGLGTGIDF